jgi:hypothetical protein
MTLAETEPADPRRQPLKRDPFAGKIQPAMQSGIVRKKLLDLAVGLVG